MKKNKSLQLIKILLLILVSLTSCQSQNKQKIEEENLHNKDLFMLPIEKDSSAQISEYVVSILEDSKGNLWFGTVSDGAVRFDGKSFRYFTTKDGLCDDTVASLAEDKEGNIWLGTHAGVARFDGKAFTNFTASKGITGMGGKILVDRKGNIWAGTNDGAFRYNGTSFIKFDIPIPNTLDSGYKWVPGKIWSIMEDKNGNIWFGRDGYGACKYDGKKFTHFSKINGLVSNNVSNIIEDDKGNIWFNTLTDDFPIENQIGGLSRYDGKTFTQFEQLEGLTKNSLYSIYKDTKGDIWIGATGLGVYHYNNKEFKLYKGTDRMDLTWSNGIQSILQDSKGTLWFGYSGGLFRFDGKGIVNVSKTELQKLALKPN